MVSAWRNFKNIFSTPLDRGTLRCFGSYADIGISYLGNSTYMKVILTKNLTFSNTSYHTKFQFEKISRTMKKMWFFKFRWLLYSFYVLKNGKFSQGSRHFRKLKLCMINNIDKSRVFCHSKPTRRHRPRPVAAPASVSERWRSALFKNPLFSGKFLGCYIEAAQNLIRYVQFLSQIGDKKITLLNWF